MTVTRREMSKIGRSKIELRLCSERNATVFRVLTKDHLRKELTTNPPDTDHMLRTISVSRAMDRTQSRSLSRCGGHFLQRPRLHFAGDAFRQVFYTQNPLLAFEVRQALARSQETAPA